MNWLTEKKMSQTENSAPQNETISVEELEEKLAPSGVWSVVD